MNFVKSQRRKMGGVIIRIFAPAEDLLLGREDPHHGEQITVDLDLLAYGRIAAEKFLGCVRPQNHYIGSSLRLLRREETSLGNVVLIDVRGILRFAMQGGVLNLMAPVLDRKTTLSSGRRAVPLRRIDRDDMAPSFQGLAIFIGQLLSSQHFGGGARTEDRKAKDPIHIGSQGLDDAIHVAAEAVDDGGDENDGGAAD